jgi:hypothetical protein
LIRIETWDVKDFEGKKYTRDDSNKHRINHRLCSGFSKDWARVDGLLFEVLINLSAFCNWASVALYF